ncbi:hypothetical protein [Planctomycetes bacterium K23_9]|uniref:Uncharacterized protein n=1 Tax=Stieleria marina TaxID=1930275 RepID=A0A517NR40_9BACT|nr:hypothetical protein K239x_15430 [Planctomycetes bacterium K23_9]
MPNPYSAATNIPSEQGIFAESADLLRSAFLYRMIRVHDPNQGSSPAAGETESEFGNASRNGTLITYSGWWFWQRVVVDNRRVWSKVSWVALNREITFRIPSTESSAQRSAADERSGRIEIDFGPGLRIRRFRVWVDAEIIFDEIK